ncbi:DUF4190 domain-containing protein [Cellulosimicrobium sp. Marseille-Q4280]|jgi:hypothetical protein|uniref:DUF4190 domain-containing protein n=1 Tax=Cellulosimicrobium sp. Marseille-Q4280 TaxID=2937992 RepID=UPI00203C7AB3|nr:DUF4190 domain-containing protein [Cellulosimicrobium sp. Marseille-Q4280]
MSTPDQPQQPQEPNPSGPPSFGGPQQGGSPQYGASTPQGGAPQYGAPQAPQYGAPQAPQYGESTPGYSAPAQNPGKTLGIVGFVLSFLGCLSIVGIILSIVALNKSKKAGYGNGLAIAGIIIGVLVLIGTIIGGWVFWQGVQILNEACVGVPSGETVVYEGVNVTCP